MEDNVPQNCEINFTMDIENENTSVENSTLTLICATANEPVQQDASSRPVKSYKEMLNSAKKTLITLEGFQNQLLQLQDVHFDSVILFDPEIIEILLDSKWDKCGQKFGSLSRQNKNGDGESLDDKYEAMCQTLAQYGNKNN